MMNNPDEAWLDEDIRALSLTSSEKAGLQVYRNYARSFETHALSEFRKVLDNDMLDLGDFRRVVSLVATEDPRFLPIIACGYADDVLKDVFRRLIPADIPGGVNEMLGGYGPLSDLSKRIRLAFAFDELSKDVLKDLDSIRSVRNRIAHDWDIEVVRDFYMKGRISNLAPIENFWPENHDLSSVIKNAVEPVAVFRIRIVWILGRLTFEANAYSRAKQARLVPHAALYGRQTRWLIDIATICMEQTRVIASEKNP